MGSRQWDRDPTGLRSCPGAWTGSRGVGGGSTATRPVTFSRLRGAGRRRGRWAVCEIPLNNYSQEEVHGLPRLTCRSSSSADPLGRPRVHSSIVCGFAGSRSKGWMTA